MAHLRAAGVVSSESSIRFHAPYAGAEHALVNGAARVDSAQRFVIALTGMCELLMIMGDFTQHHPQPPG